MKKEYKISYVIIIPVETLLGLSNRVEKVNGLEIINANSYKEAQDIFLEDNKSSKAAIAITKIELIK